MTLDLGVVDVSCPGYNDGFVELNISGGIPPYTIEGETDNLSAGDYEISVSDSNSCGATVNFTILQPSQLNFDFDIVNAESSISMDGNIFIENISGGTPPYGFEWENGETTEDLTNIPFGLYNLLITDANACSYSFGFEVDFNTAANNLSSLAWKAHLQPNIVVNRMNTQLHLNAGQKAKGELQIYDLRGDLLSNVTIDIQLGEQQFNLNLEDLASGVYFVKLDVEDLGVELFRLVIAN